MSTQKKFERLPTTVKPTLYDLFLRPNLKTFKFSGKETIYIEIERPVDKIVLNSKELAITGAQMITDALKGEILTPEINLVAEDETLTLQFPKEVPAGKAKLTIEFDGELNDKMVGFYRSKYIKVADEEAEYFAVSQFEASDARRCFPCWDEPAIKACFDVTLEVVSTKVALSNMPVEKEEPIADGWKRVKFSRTPRMSTYLVAFVVGDFDYVEDTSSDGVLVRVYTPPGKKEQGRFALFVASKVLPYYKEYFQIAYPLPKMDLVAVSEMACGAMENWGLVTYRETYLLVDETNTSAATKQHVAVVVGHELAHQWFGNLVTMEWWTHLWLNEGYASFVEYLCVDYLFPEYDIWTQFVTSVYCRAFELDALENSHPIEVPVGAPSEVEEIFDEISYDKGASVIRMLHKYIGESDFRKGMNLYLTRHQYSNTFTEDLWAALEEASGKPIKAVMSTWTKQVGFPVLTVESSVQEGDSRTLVLTQSKFCAENAKQDEQTLWLIPVSFCTKSNPQKECFCTMMETRQCKVTIPNVAADDWIKLNQGAVGFFRTKYPSTMIQQFVPSIEDKSLPPLDRLGILDDLFALVQIGQADTAQALDVIWAMKNEDNYTVWANISSCLEKVQCLLVNTDCLKRFDAYGIQIMEPIYKQLGYENKPNESHLSTLLRSLVLNRLIRFGATHFTDAMREKFQRHCSGVSVIPADERSAVYRTVIAADGKKAFDELIKLYGKTDLQEEKDRILKAFSAVVDPDLVDEILLFTQSSILNPPSAATALCSIAWSKVGHVKSFSFVRDNYDKLHAKYSGGFLLARIIKSTTENFASEEKANEIEAFFAKQDTGGVERAIQQSVETIRNNATWLRRDEALIKRYLHNLKL